MYFKIFFSAGTILDHLVGEDVIADYLLYSLNRLGKFRWDFFFPTIFWLCAFSVYFFPLCVTTDCLPHACGSVQLRGKI